MFQNLIESASHRQDLARRGRFFLGTLALYGVLVAFAGVASVYAYNAHLDEQNYEVTMLPPWALPAATQTVEHTPAHPSHATGGEVPVRKDFVLDLNTPPRTPPPISTTYSAVKPLPPGFVVPGPVDIDPRNIGVAGPGNPGGDEGGAPVGGNSRPHVVIETDDVRPPEVVKPTPAPTPARPLMLSHLISSKIVSKPVPPYPQLAIVARIQGTVSVEILVDEQGRVISATATNGPVMLREAARLAALQARFTPTQLNGQPVKISGVISYNFTLR
ncbi:MAG: periplasmic protein TonB [Acidobacteriota bacterium]|nr:periplasmic protein TonB [Acidobacteriota bacterium]